MNGAPVSGACSSALSSSPRTVTTTPLPAITRVTPGMFTLPTGIAPNIPSLSHTLSCTRRNELSDASISDRFIGLTIGRGPWLWWLPPALVSARANPTVPTICTRSRSWLNQNSGISITCPIPRSASALPVGSVAASPKPAVIVRFANAGTGTRSASARSPSP